MMPVDIDDEISTIAAYVKAVEMIVTNKKFPADKGAADAAIELVMVANDKIKALQERLDADTE